MCFILAELKGQSDKIFRVCKFSEDIEVESTTDSHKYTPHYKLEQGQWFYIKNFLSKQFKNPFIHEKIKDSECLQIDKSLYNKIIYLCISRDKFLLFQKITPKYILRKKLITFKDTPELSNEPRIIVNDYNDAIYDTENDILYFKNLNKIKGIFKNIENLYTEATDEQIDKFTSDYKIKFSKNFTKKDIGVFNRKNIALAIDSNIKNHESFCDYIQKYSINIECENGYYMISSNDNLKNFIDAINEKYYETEYSEEKRKINSFKTLEQ